MELLKDFQVPENDEGTEVVFSRGEKHPEDSAFVKVRRIPKEQLRLIQRRHSGRKTPMLIKPAGRLLEVDNDKAAAEQIEQACYALVDTRNFDVRAGDDEAAAFYTEALGTTVKKGDLVRLDGKWTKEVKERLFTANAPFASKVVVLAMTLDRVTKAAIEEEEEGKDEN